MLNISFSSKELYENESIVVLVDNTAELDLNAMEVDQKFHGIISKSIQNTNRFSGKSDQILTFTAVDSKGSVKNILVLCIGDQSEIAEYQIEELGGRIFLSAKAVKSASVGIKIPQRIGNFTEDKIAALIASGAVLGSYRYDKYFTKKSKSEDIITKSFNIIVEDQDKAEKLYEEKKAINEGVYLARDLTNEVPNVLYPETYAERIVDELEPLSVGCEVLGEREMYELGMGALLGVGQGSAKESKTVIMQYNGGTAGQKPLCFVGKGVTFDTGGISIKSAGGMGDMKYDMAGSAAVVGLIKGLALRKAKVNVVGIVGLVENMPGSNAQRPGDVVKTMSGQTVEILNTDAEGRLVLCDCLTYLQEKFDPECVVDLATLTGAITISLAHTYAGIFSNDDELADKLIKSSLRSNEKLWRMPLHADYDNMIKSPVADMANIGSEKGAAGSNTAAQFLKRFIKDGIKWAHLDIAGTAWDKIGKCPIYPKGAVGFGVRLLNQFIQDHYESK